MKIFWSVHYCFEEQDTYSLDKLLKYIDSQEKACLVILPRGGKPSVFIDRSHRNNKKVRNRFIPKLDHWGFPTLTDIQNINTFVKNYFMHHLPDANHYLFGAATQDCVARMGRAMIYGKGFSYFTDDNTFKNKTTVSTSTALMPEYKNPIADIRKVNFIEELCYPNKQDCSLGTHSSSYCDFVRIYTNKYNLIQKPFVSLDSILS